jgi:hypothetical protein
MKDVGGFAPFFVADRQASLRILSGLKVPDGRKFGIMTHANVFEPFKEDLRAFPCFDKANCGVVDGPCPYNENIDECKEGKRLRETTIKICDSGVFQRHGCEQPTYSALFQQYERMNVDYGIIMDVLKNKDATLLTAKIAMEEYKKFQRPFNLIGVAQGETIEEYIECYKKLKEIGYEYVAIGGMLKRKERSARYVLVRNEILLKQILSEIRKIDPNGWLFALGCYSPKRHSIFLEHGVFGSDYKGWIFQYKTCSPKRGDVRAQKKRFKEVRSFLDEQVMSRSQEHRAGPRLLIVPCSKKKTTKYEKTQAINLYDGPLYHSLRKYVHDFSNNDGLDIMILSAKYGLIEPKKIIQKYDQRMTIERATALAPSCRGAIKQLLSEKDYDKVIINLSADYMKAFEEALEEIDQGKLVQINGRNGMRLHETIKWILS